MAWDESKRRRGEDMPQAKLTADQVREIRRLHASTSVGMRTLAREYGVSRHNIQLILSRETWAWLDAEVSA